MKKFFVVIAGVTVTVIVGIVVAIVILLPRVSEFDRTGREFAQRLVGLGLRTWNLEGVRSVSSTQLLSAMSEEDFSRLFADCASRLGNIETFDEPTADFNVHMGFKNFREMVTAEYVVTVRFERAEGQVTVELIREDKRWKVLGLHVNSPATSSVCETLPRLHSPNHELDEKDGWK